MYCLYSFIKHHDISPNYSIKYLKNTMYHKWRTKVITKKVSPLLGLLILVLGSSLNQPYGVQKIQLYLHLEALKITLMHRPHLSSTKSESQKSGPSLLPFFSKFSQGILKDKADNHWVEAWMMRD